MMSGDRPGRTDRDDPVALPAPLALPPAPAASSEDVAGAPVSASARPDGSADHDRRRVGGVPEIIRIRRPLIVELAPVAEEGREGLSSRSRNSLCRLLTIPAGLFDELFDGTSLLREWRWPLPNPGEAPPVWAMRAQAWALVCSARWRTSSKVVLLGREVARAFGLRSGDAYLRWIEWGYWKGRRVAIFPHPAGAGRAWWERPANEIAARRFLCELGGLDPDEPSQKRLAGI